MLRQIKLEIEQEAKKTKKIKKTMKEKMPQGVKTAAVETKTMKQEKASLRKNAAGLSEFEELNSEIMDRLFDSDSSDNEYVFDRGASVDFEGFGGMVVTSGFFG